MLEEKDELIPQPIIEINDPRVLAIPDNDNGEPMVSLQDMLNKGNLLLPSQVITQIEGIEDTETPLVREGIKAKIELTVKALGEKYALVVVEPYRSYEFQKELFEDRVKEIMKGGDIKREEAEKTASSFVSNPDIYSPHVTGGAIDVAIVDKNTGDYLDMGNKFEYDEKATTKCGGLTPEQTINRQLLIEVMEKAGFVNYPNEWWHWSDGDKYAAIANGQSQAKYSKIN